MKKKYIVILSIVGVLILAHLLLPSILLKQINTRLGTLPEYEGHVEDIDLALYRGAVQLNDFSLHKKQGDEIIPFVSIETVDFSIDWKALFNGRIVARTTTIRPTVNFVASTDTTEEQFGGDYLWFEELAEMRPLEINKFEVVDGEIHYRQFDSEPKIDLVVSNIDIVAKNLRNVVSKNKTLPSSIDVSATVLDSGNLTSSVKINLIKEIPDLNANVSLESVGIPSFNDYLRVHTKMDAAKGELNFYSEVAVDDGNIRGYFKPLIEELDWAQQGENATLLGKIKEGGSDLLSKLLSNPKSQKIASKIPLSGSIEDTDVNIWRTMYYLFRNAFVDAIEGEVEHTISYPILQE